MAADFAMKFAARDRKFRVFVEFFKEMPKFHQIILDRSIRSLIKISSWSLWVLFYTLPEPMPPRGRAKSGFEKWCYAVANLFVKLKVFDVCLRERMFWRAARI